MMHFLNSLWSNRFRLHSKRAEPKTEVESDASVYEIDQTLRTHLLRKAYKETPGWKKGATKRRIAWILLFLPLISYAFIFGAMALSGVHLATAAVDASVVPSIAMVVLWPIAIIMLKVQYHNAKIIPEDRRNDRLVLSEDGLVYTYFCTTDGHTYTAEMKYKYISRLEVSTSRKTLFVFGPHQTHAVKGKRSEIAIYSPYIIVPLYFADHENMVKCLSSKCLTEIKHMT